MTELSRRAILHLAAGAAVLPAVSRPAFAPEYPTRPVHLVFGISPSDKVKRMGGTLAL